MTTTQSRPQVVCKENRLLMVGDGGVGKAALIGRFIYGRFFPDYDPTIADSHRKRVVVDDEAILMDILSTHAGEDFGPSDHAVEMCHGFLLVYSITQRSSFNRIRAYHEDIRRIRGQDALTGVIIIANKCDLETERVVNIQEGRDLAAELGCSFMETSAKQGVNVEEAFMDVVRQIPRVNAVKSIPSESPELEAQGKGQHVSRCGGCVAF
ncbi:Ras-like protein [Mycena sanguinolenta]|uniref:Ras-like protein n=1 Tax=Mycena sanguinolenta TaxID=230812 RepID=A0A8H7DA86_9AGAR|nr:Ras-like protein [Mycena sanguinolenta]